MKKLLLLAAMTFSMNAFSGVKTLNLSPMDTLTVTCSKGLELEINKNSLKCVCPKNSIAHFEGENLKCDVACEIKQEHVEYTEEVYADQSAEVIGTNFVSYDAIVLRDFSGKILFIDKIYSPRKVELDFLLDAAVKAAGETCKKILYKGNEIQK